MGTVRISYNNKKSVFEYGGVRRPDADNVVLSHLTRCRYETVTKLGEAAQLGSVREVQQEVDLSTVVATWTDAAEGAIAETLTVPIKLSTAPRG